MKKIKNKKMTISREDIQKAMRAYFSRSGRIRKLPAQKVFSSTYVGGEKWNIYESFDTLAWAK